MQALCRRARTNRMPVEASLRGLINECLRADASMRPRLEVLVDACEKGVAKTALDYAIRGSPWAFYESDAILKQFLKKYIFDAEANPDRPISQFRI